MFEIPDDDDTFWENIPNAFDVPVKELPRKRPYVECLERIDHGKKSKGQWSEGFVSAADKNIQSYSTATHNANRRKDSRYSLDHRDIASIRYEALSAKNIQVNAHKPHSTLSNQNDNACVSSDLMRGRRPKDTHISSVSTQALDHSKMMFNLAQSSEDSMDTDFHFSPVISNSANNAKSSFVNNERISEKFVNHPGFDMNENVLTSAYDDNITENRLTVTSSTSHRVHQKLVHSILGQLPGVISAKCPETPVLFESPARVRLPESHASVTHSSCTTPSVPIVSINSIETTSKSRRRVFPGPAGVLPHLSCTATSLAESPIITASVRRLSPEAEKFTNADLPLSQNTADVFSDKPWKTLLADLGDDAAMFLQRFSIADVLLKANRRQLSGSKVSLLFTVIDNIDYQGAEACTLLRDKTGTIQGTLHRELLKQFEASIHIGAVMVLRQVGVISPTPRNHYLNITPSNIVIIYSKEMESNDIQKHVHGTPAGETSQSSVSAMDLNLKTIIREISVQQQKEQNKWATYSMNNTSNLSSSINSPSMIGPRQEMIGGHTFNSPSTGIMAHNRNNHNVRSTLWHSCGPQTSQFQPRKPLVGARARRPVAGTPCTPQPPRYNPAQRRGLPLQQHVGDTPQPTSNLRTVGRNEITASVKLCQNSFIATGKDLLQGQSCKKSSENLNSPCVSTNQQVVSNNINIYCSVTPCGTPTQNKAKWRFKSASPNISISSPELSPDNSVMNMDRTNLRMCTNSSASNIMTNSLTTNSHYSHVRDSGLANKPSSVMSNLNSAFQETDLQRRCKTNEESPPMSDTFPLTTDDNFWQDDLTDELLQQIVTDDM